MVSHRPLCVAPLSSVFWKWRLSVWLCLQSLQVHSLSWRDCHRGGLPLPGQGEQRKTKHTLLIPTLQQAYCSTKSDGVGASISGVISVGNGSETDLRMAVSSAGPVAVSIDASDKAFIVSAEPR